MRKVVILGLIGAFLVSCAKKKPNPETLNYSLLDGIYKEVEKADIERVKTIEQKDVKIFKVPKYLKVFRGSYRDDNGNVVEAGYEYIKIDNGEPDTNF